MIDRESKSISSLLEHEQTIRGMVHSDVSDDPVANPMEVEKALAAVRFLDEVRQALHQSTGMVGEPNDSSGSGAEKFGSFASGRFSEYFGPYRLERHVGQGGFADVFLASDPVLQRKVALKILRPSVVVNSGARIRFEREARAVARLGHPNIVPLYATGTVGSLMYLAFEYCTGDSLSAWLKRQTTPPDFRLIAKLVIDLAEALEHAHRRGVIHRDMKPSNIMLQKASDTEEIDSQQPRSVMITDFGLASLGFDSLELTKDGTVLGTPNYMSPEQANSQELTTATDIYSLGVIMFELLTLRLPFEHETPLGTIKAVSESNFPSPTRFRRNIPTDLVAICLKATQREARERYRTAFDFAEDLRCWLDHRPVQARRLHFFQALAQKIRRQPFVSSLIALTMVSLLSGTSIAWWQWANARASLHQALQQGTRAERHLEQLSVALDRVLHSIPETEAITPQQFEMLHELLAIHRTLLPEEPGNPNIGRDTIRILNRLAQINALLARFPDVVAEFERLQVAIPASELQRIFAAGDSTDRDREEMLELFLSAGQAFNELDLPDRSLVLLDQLDTLVGAIPENSKSDFREWSQFRLDLALGRSNRVAGRYDRSIRNHEQAEKRGAKLVSSLDAKYSQTQIQSWLILNQSELARSYLSNGNYLLAWETQQSVIRRRLQQLEHANSAGQQVQRIRLELARDHLTGVSILSVIGAIPAMREQLGLARTQLSELQSETPDSDLIKLEVQETYLWLAHIDLLEGDFQNSATNARTASQLRFSQQRKLPRQKIQEVKSITAMAAAYWRMDDLTATTATVETLIPLADQLLQDYPTNIQSSIAWAKAVLLQLSVLNEMTDDGTFGKTLLAAKDHMNQILRMRIHPQEKAALANQWSVQYTKWATWMARSGNYTEAFSIANEIHKISIPTSGGRTRPNVLPATQSLVLTLMIMKDKGLEDSENYGQIRNQAAGWISEAIQRGWITQEQWRSDSKLESELGNHPQLSHAAFSPN